MTRRQASAGMLASAALAAGPATAMAQEPKARQLPPPHQDGGMPLMAALKHRRHSTREYSNRPLAAQTLSDLLWAAFGINRPSGDRTAPYWRHVMVIDVYAAMSMACGSTTPRRMRLLPLSEGRTSALRLVCRTLSRTRRSTSSMSRMENVCRTSRRRAPPLRFGRYRLHRPKCLSVLRLGGSRHGVSRRRRPSEARPGDDSSRTTVRDVRPDGRLSPAMRCDISDIIRGRHSARAPFDPKRRRN